MKPSWIPGVALIVLSPFLTQTAPGQAGPVSLTLSDTARVEISWPSAATNASQTVYPEYTVRYSPDLTQWTALGGKVRAIEGRSGPTLSLSLEQQPASTFFRVDVDLNSTTTNRMGAGGAEVFGYNAQFDQEINALGFLSAGEFATNAPQFSYLPRITWDPTTAQYWTNFYSTNLFFDVSWDGYNKTPYNYRLDDAELSIFLTNGFVVSERLGNHSFARAFYRLYHAEFPVFISADCVLHAWHRSYQSILAELEQLAMVTLLERMVTNMAAQLPQAWQQYGAGPLRDSILDADYYLTVAGSLLAGQQVPNALAAGQSQAVTDTLSAISNETLVVDFPLFGTRRVVDFSQFKVRGHYTASERLRRYFRTMMWCGRMDLRLATFAPNGEDDIRQLGTAVVLHDLLTSSGEMGDWQTIEEITRLFVGITDSMTFPQLGDLLLGAGIHSPGDVPNLLTLTNLQTRLLTGELGVQNIHGHFFWSPLGPEQVKLPRSFTVTGQKFVLDSWACSQVVFDRVLWDESLPGVLFGKVLRRKPSCLDVAFSVLGNDHVVPELVARIRSTNGVPFRDGLPYQHNLLAVRRTIDSQNPAIWTNNIYMAWLAALRALSAPTTDSKYPEAMRTRAWAMKSLNTQLASWTELRHDTLLYAKQSYTGGAVCGYPAGFVEPHPEFWGLMDQLARLTASSISSLPLSGEVIVTNYWTPITVDLGAVKSKEIEFLASFSDCMLTLQDIAKRELAQQPLTATQTDMLKQVVERSVAPGDCVFRWDGWYPGLYYTNFLERARGGGHPGADIWDALVVDVHTDPPDLDFSGDPGAVIHEATAHIPLLMIAVDNGPDRMLYAGPVLSHYEFEAPGVQRLSDEDWQDLLRGGLKPSPPEWTESWLVPR